MWQWLDDEDEREGGSGLMMRMRGRWQWIDDEDEGEGGSGLMMRMRGKVAVD